MKSSLTFTDEQSLVINETHRTLAAETSKHVDTHAVLTHSGDLTTLVNICTHIHTMLVMFGSGACGCRVARLYISDVNRT